MQIYNTYFAFLKIISPSHFKCQEKALHLTTAPFELVPVSDIACKFTDFTCHPGVSASAI